MSKTAVFGLFVLILLPKVFRLPAKGLAGRPARRGTLRTSRWPRREPKRGWAERRVRGAGCLRNEPNRRPARVSCIWGPLEHQLVPDSDCSSPAAPSFRLRGPLTILGSRCFNISLPAPAPTARRTAGALPAISLPPSPQARGPSGPGRGNRSRLRTQGPAGTGPPQSGQGALACPGHFIPVCPLYLLSPLPLATFPCPSIL